MKKTISEGMSGKFRSREVRIRIGIVVRGHSQEAQPFKEVTETILVAAHGGLIILKSPVAAGQKVRVVNAKSGEEVTCTVNLVLGDMRDKKNVQISFDEPSPRFWGLQFPPDDWDPKTRKRPGAREL
jgi:hypothetical protein